MKQCIEVLEISPHPIAQVKSIGRIQIISHWSIWQVRFSFSGNYNISGQDKITQGKWILRVAVKI